jgi:hypothetical protein
MKHPRAEARSTDLPPPPVVAMVQDADLCRPGRLPSAVTRTGPVA